MKKINLNQLSMSWNEKQMPQKFRRYAGMLIMLLTLGVGQMWATDLYVRGYSSWDGVTANKMSGTSSPWTFTAYWSTNGEFKIGTNDWSIDLGSANIAAWGTKYNLTSKGNNMSFPSLATGGGIYTITVTLESSTYKIKVDKVTEEQSTWRQISAPKIYWDNTSANYTNVTMINGRYTNYGGDGKGTLASPLTHITNTNLWYNTSISNGTGDGSQFTSTLFVDADWDGWENNNVPTERAMYATSNTAVNTAALNSNTFLFSAANGNRGATLSRTQLSSGYSELNKTQTIKVYVKAAGGSYTEKTSSWPGTITPDRYYLSDATTATHVNNVALTASSSVTTSAVLTSQFKLVESGTATGYTFDGWGTSSSGPTVTGTDTYTISAITGTNTIYAFFSEKTYSVAFSAGSHGSITTPASSPKTVGQITGISIEADPDDDYEFSAWSSSSGGSFTSASSASTTFYPTAATTVTASFRSARALTVLAGSHVGAVTGSSDPVSLGVKYPITASSFTSGYEFDEWTADPAENATFDNSKSASTNVTVSTGSVTVTANAKESMRTITIVGGTIYGGAATSTTAGVATPAKVTANAPAAGKKFTGWTLGSGVSLKGGYSLTDRTIEIYSTADATVTANFADRAGVKVYFAKPSGWSTAYVYAWKSSDDSKKNATWPGVAMATTEVINYVTYYTYQYYTEGDGIGGGATGSSEWNSIKFTDNGDESKRTDDLTISNGHYYFKSSTGTGKSAALTSAWCIKGAWNSWSEDADQITHSAAATGSKTITLTTGNKEFKIYNIVNETWWRFSGNVTATKAATTMANNIDGNMTLTPTIAGNYTFALASLTGTPTLAITYPTAYQLNYAIGSVAGTSGSISSSPTTATGSYVASGNTVTLTAPDEKTGYTWKGWYGNAAGTGDRLCATKAYAITMNADKTVYACYTEKEWNVSVSAGSGGSVSPTGTVAIKQVSGTSLTATPSTNYVFEDWTISGGGITPTTSSTNPQVFKATTTGGTIRANFIPQWSLVGSGDEFGNWDATAHRFGNFGTNSSSQDTCTVELTLPANTQFTFKVFDYSQTGDDRYWGNSTDGPHYMNYASNNKQWWGFNKGNTYKDCGLTTAGAGTYKFEWNITTKQLRVYFPTSYAVNFGQGTGNGTAVTATVEGDAAALSASGKYAAAGKDITFTQSAASGYTFKGWYTASSGGTTVSGMSTSDNVLDDIAANANVYAQYTEDMHTVTVTVDEHGTITTPAGGSGSTVTAGIATGAAIVAVADYGYVFNGWTVESGSATFANDKALSTTVNATADATIKANFFPHWSVAGSKGATPTGKADDPMGDWDTHTNGIDNFEEISTGVWQGYVDITLPANTLFYFKIRDLNNSNWYGNTGNMDYGNHTNWTMATDKGNCRITTAGAGTYRFTWNETNKQLTVTYPDSYTITFGKVVDNGQNIGGVSAIGDDDSTLVSGKYVAKGSATFTAAEAEYYSFVDWRTSSTYGDGDQLSTENPYTMTSIAANKTVYANYAENMTTIAISHNEHGEVQLSSSPVTSITAGAVTTRSITAVPAAGYYFAGWEITEGTDFTVSGTGEANTTITVTGGGAGATSGQTLKANFVEENKIYFRNIFDDGAGNVSRWSDVYVYFDITWDAGKAVTSVNSAYKAQMTQIEGTDVYWAYVPRAFTNSGHKAVGFADESMTTSYTFYNVTASGTKAATRNDYSYLLNMYVPNHTPKSTNVNGVDYFDNGYWMRYDTRASQGAGYYFKIYNSRNNYTQEGEFIATNDNATYIQYKHRVDNTDADKTRFMFTSAGALNYIASETIDGANALSNINVYENVQDPKDNDIYFQLTATSEGYYTFILDQSSDVMKITVIYPVSPGDYQLVYTYNSGAKTHASDVIKADKTSSTTVARNVSMYIDPTVGTNTLKLQKCTSINETTKLPEWTSGVSVGTLSDYFKVGNTATKGVYVFDLTIVDGNAVSADVTSATVSDATIYDGDFYIKTDYAPGGWVNYTQNVMDENTINYDKTKPETFDYYFCKWIDEGKKNVKCVIANEYSQQITDTLVSDDILGIDASTSKPREYLAVAANVRFSYNSYTNELKRAYINGATAWQTSFLRVSAGGAVIKGYYGNTWTNNDTTFTDNNNWIYILDMQAQEHARVKLTANYRFNDADHVQYFKGASGDYSDSNTEEIIGGPESGTAWLKMRMVYDFKTNHLIAAWLAEDIAAEKTEQLDADMMVIRDNQGDARQITLGAGASITNVDTAYSVVHLTRAHLTNKTIASGYASDSTLSVYERQFYWVSFPYDVNISDIIGSVGTYGYDWILQCYDGKKRAREGYWLESGPNWRFMDKSETLNAFEGYVLTLDLSEFGYGGVSNPGKWLNNVVDLYLYFPSNGDIGSITSKDYVVPFDQTGYKCTIDRSKEVHNGKELGPEYDRTVRDSYWHCIGIPSFAAYTDASTSWNTGVNAETKKITWETENLPFLYEWNKETNVLTPVSSSSFTFKPMVAYLVQYGESSMTWSSVVSPPASAVVARQKVAANNSNFAEFTLELQQNEQSLDHTYVRMTDNEDVTTDFEFGHDLCKEYQPGANIYTIIDQLEVAGNSLPISEQTTIVPVGVKIASNGDYTFAMPEGTNGVGVILVDNATGTRTNLGLTDYTVNLTSGKIDNRFWLEISPIQNAPTGIETVSGDGLEMRGARKVMIDGLLYIVKDGKIFDAQGRNIQ